MKKLISKKIDHNLLLRSAVKPEERYLSKDDVYSSSLIAKVIDARQEIINIPNTTQTKEVLVLILEDITKALVISNTSNYESIRSILIKKGASELTIGNVIGLNLEIYCDKTVKLKGAIVGGIRIKPYEAISTEEAISEIEATAESENFSKDIKKLFLKYKANYYHNPRLKAAFDAAKAKNSASAKLKTPKTEK